MALARSILNDFTAEGNKKMGALTILPGNGAPPARSQLVALAARIDRAEREAGKIRSGRAKLRDQLELVDGARNELESLIARDSITLVDRIKNSVDWALSGFGGPRATRIAESLAASRLQNEIGSKAAAELDAEIERLEAELESLRSQKAAAVKAVLVESAEGLLNDLATAVSQLRDTMTALAALDRITARSNGEWSPNASRVAVRLPAIGGLGEQAVVVSATAINVAVETWRRFAEAVDRDPMTRADDFLNFDADAGGVEIVPYEALSPIERRQVDARAAGCN
jgi:chaperonin cofactor prefoldin